MKVFINPGHGGLDTGAVGCGLVERDVTRVLGLRVAQCLKAVGYDVALFQYDGLEAICAEAEDFEADLFVSIHCNSFDGQVYGTETYHAPYSAKGWLAANAVQSQLIRSLPTTDRGIKTERFYVLMNTSMPAILIETAFIDNPADAVLLRYRHDDFAHAIARGVTDFFAKVLP